VKVLGYTHPDDGITLRYVYYYSYTTDSESLSASTNISSSDPLELNKFKSLPTFVDNSQRASHFFRYFLFISAARDPRSFIYNLTSYLESDVTPLRQSTQNLKKLEERIRADEYLELIAGDRDCRGKHWKHADTLSAVSTLGSERVSRRGM
jgi:hypothetical protein